MITRRNLKKLGKNSDVSSSSMDGQMVVDKPPRKYIDIDFHYLLRTRGGMYFLNF